MRAGEHLLVTIFDPSSARREQLAAALTGPVPPAGGRDGVRVECFSSMETAVGPVAPGSAAVAVCSAETVSRFGWGWIRRLARTLGRPVVVLTESATPEGVAAAVRGGAADVIFGSQVRDEPQWVRRAVVAAAMQRRTDWNARCAQRRVRDDRRSLARRVREQHRAVREIVHDLKTPLDALAAASDELSVAVARSDFRRCGEWAMWIDRLTARLGAMVNMAARAGEPDPGGDQEASLVDLVRRVVDEVSPIATARGVTVRAERACGTVRGDGGMLHRALLNIIGNAVEYSPPHAGAAVMVACDTEPGAARVRVENAVVLSPQTGHAERGPGMGRGIADGIVRGCGGRLAFLESGDRVRATIELRRADERADEMREAA